MVRAAPEVKKAGYGRTDLIEKLYPTARAALEGLKDGDTLLIGGFGDAGVPFHLIDGVLETGAKDLTVVANNAGFAGTGGGGCGRSSAPAARCRW